ncbi:MAG TPA: hypothetical protein VK550_15670 [Polyangiaceae bacterium]|nr:hypothetical protein [Polyangiaceae bacterium]
MLDRKEFLTGIAGVTVTFFVTACGGDDSEASPGEGDGDCMDDIGVAVTNNHGHDLRIAFADVDAAQSHTYNIKGTSDHDHAVTLTTQDFTDLKSGKKVLKESTSNAGHSHPIQILC